MSGKSLALADWSFRQDKAEFVRLVARLRARRWAQLNPERVRENNRKADRRRYARRRDERAWLVRGHVLTCEWCKTQWCRIPCRYMGPEPKFCCREHMRAAQHAKVMADSEKRAAAVARVVEWQRANREKTREKARRHAQKKRAQARQEAA